MKLPKQNKEKKSKKSEKNLVDDVNFLKNVLPEKDFEKIVKENIPQQQVATIIKEKYLETLKKNPEKENLIHDNNSEDTKNELLKELFGNLDNLIKIYNNSAQNEENKHDSSFNEIKESKSTNYSDKKTMKIGFNTNIINAGNFKVNTEELDDRIPLCLNNNTVNFKLSKICYKENIERSISSTENSQDEDEYILENEEEEEEEDEEEEKESVKLFDNLQKKNNRYSEVFEEEEYKNEENEENTQEETPSNYKNENDSKKTAAFMEDLKKKKKEFLNKVNELKKQCIKMIGEQKFNKIYQFYLNQCEKNKELDNSDNDKINDYISQEISSSNIEFMTHFCQIIYYELQLQYIDQELMRIQSK